MTAKKILRLKNPDVICVSAVPKGANKRDWLIVKELEETTGETVMAEEKVVKGDVVSELAEQVEAVAEVADPILEAVETIEAEAAAPAPEEPTPETVPEQPPEAPMVIKSESDEAIEKLKAEQDALKAEVNALKAEKVEKDKKLAALKSAPKAPMQAAHNVIFGSTGGNRMNPVLKYFRDDETNGMVARHVIAKHFPDALIDPNAGDMTASLIEKSGEITSGTTLASSGKLNATQEMAFLTKVKAESKLLGLIDVIVGPGPSYQLVDTDVAARVMRKGTEITASGNTSFTTAKRDMTTFEAIITRKLSYMAFEDAIAGRTETISGIDAMFARAWANDLEDAGINCDTTVYTDDSTFLGMDNGWIRILKTAASPAVTDYVWATDVDIEKTFDDILALMPNKYLDEARVKLIVSPAVARTYRNQLRSRNTSVGDAAVVDAMVPRFAGIELISVPKMPNEAIILTDPKNLCMYQQRGMTVESDRVITTRLIETVMSARIDFEVKNPAATVLAYSA